MTQPMLQIDWLDGRITRYPEYSVADAFGQNVQPELEIRLDDLSDGIWLLLRHNEPVKPQQGVHKEADPRGQECIILADCFYQIATKEDIPNIAILSHEGVPVLCNWEGEAVRLSRVNSLMALHVGCSTGSVIGDVAALAAALEARAAAPGTSDEELAETMLVPASLVRAARPTPLARAVVRGAARVNEGAVLAPSGADFS